MQLGVVSYVETIKTKLNDAGFIVNGTHGKIFKIKKHICQIDEFMMKVTRLEFDVLVNDFNPFEHKIPESRNHEYGFNYFWGGADVFITEEDVDSHSRRIVICSTPHAYSVSAIYRWCIRNESGIFDYINRYKFFAHPANMLNKAQNNRQASLSDVEAHLVIIDAIKSILLEWRLKAIDELNPYLCEEFTNLFGEAETNPFGWEMRSFEDLGIWLTGDSDEHHIDEYFGDAVSFYGLEPLNYRFLSCSDDNQISKNLLSSNVSVFPKRSLILGMRDPQMLSVSLLQDVLESNKSTACLIHNDLVNVDWLLLHIAYEREWYLSQLNGIRKKRCNLKHIKELKIPLPPIEKQTLFESMVRDYKEFIKLPSERDESLVFSGCLVPKKHRHDLSRSERQLLNEVETTLFENRELYAACIENKFINKGK
ncbi:restriction endonuclease subunit S [Marinomonas sp.]